MELEQEALIRRKAQKALAHKAMELKEQAVQIKEANRCTESFAQAERSRQNRT